MSIKAVIYSDLDGTILDEAYSYAEIQPIIRALQSLNTAIVLNSSKTRAEIEHYRTKLEIKDPFITENGSAVFIPKNYFKTPYKFSKQTAQYDIIELGTDYATLRKKLEVIKAESKAEIVGFGDMTTEELAKDTALPSTLAALSKNREYDEVFKINRGKEADVIKAIAAQGLKYTKGNRYYHLLGDTDKGKALTTLTRLYQKEGQIVTVGVGDSPNDQPMLALVDKPFLIKNNNPLPYWMEILKLVKSYTSDK